MEEKIILRRLQLSKEEITIESTTKITVEISYGNEMHSLVGGCRKFIFSIEQIDEESSPLQEGE